MKKVELRTKRASRFDCRAGNRKDVCVKETRAAFARARAEAKVERDADYKVAFEKCDALAGPAQRACVGNAKVQHGKS